MNQRNLRTKRKINGKTKQWDIKTRDTHRKAKHWVSNQKEQWRQFSSILLLQVYFNPYYLFLKPFSFYFQFSLFQVHCGGMTEEEMTQGPNQIPSAVVLWLFSTGTYAGIGTKLCWVWKCYEKYTQKKISRQGDPLKGQLYAANQQQQQQKSQGMCEMEKFW